MILGESEAALTVSSVSVLMDKRESLSWGLMHGYANGHAARWRDGRGCGGVGWVGVGGWAKYTFKPLAIKTIAICRAFKTCSSMGGASFLFKSGQSNQAEDDAEKVELNFSSFYFGYVL